MLGDGVEDLKTSIGHKPGSLAGGMGPHVIQAQFDPEHVTRRHCVTVALGGATAW
jgi:hypothetical protein